ncbi:MAG: elongation factor G [Candidatus Zixiibacteriota bacterium]|nr:MAG: elongation factor G [candidate division Zixibacteria bacterium]
MKEFPTDKIRNITLVGHGGSGKTSLLEAILFSGKVTNRMGVVDDGTTVSDYTDDEISRKISIGLSLAHLEWKSHKFNIIDTPGYADFCGDMYAGLSAGDFALITVNGVTGPEVGTDIVWRETEKSSMPRGFFINRMDKENADFSKALAQINSVYSHKAIPVTAAWGEGPAFKGVIDVLKKKAHSFDKSGNVTEAAVPDDLKVAIDGYHEKLVEVAAEADDELLEKFFDAGELTPDELKKGLAKGIADGVIIPVFAGAATENAGVTTMLDFAINYFPAPDYMGEKIGFKPGTEQIERRKIAVDDPSSLYIFKTISEPHVGELSFFKVFSGGISNGDDLQNVNADDGERIGQIFLMNGKDRKETGSIRAGDIGALVKLKNTQTGHTLCDKKAQICYEPAFVPSPVIRMAIKAKAKGDEEKIASGLARLREEDPTFQVVVDPEIRQTIISGQGELHLEATIDRLKRKFGVEVELDKPRIPYRETIRKKVEVQGKYKKQTGGRGQYGDCHLRLEPLPRGAGFEFGNEVVGGVIPTKFIPSVEKGIREAIETGGRSGCRVVDFKATVYFGSYHAVDSSDLAFKVAASMAFKDGFLKADPYVLEPIYTVDILVPEEFMGDVMGDISSKRGKILGMDSQGPNQKIKAHVPLAELHKYSTTLRSFTQGRGIHTVEFSHYEEVPREISEKIIEEAKKAKEENDK